jgi:hypothetical protein
MRKRGQALNLRRAMELNQRYTEDQVTHVFALAVATQRRANVEVQLISFASNAMGLNASFQVSIYLYRLLKDMRWGGHR